MVIAILAVIVVILMITMMMIPIEVTLVGILAAVSDEQPEKAA
jgi:hypothetical protein